MNRCSAALFCLAVGSSLGARAAWFSDINQGRRGPMVLTLDPSVRSQGLGGASTASADDGGALFWNPAGLQKMKRQEFGFSHAALFGEQTQDTAVYVRPAWRWSERETWALSITRLADAPLDVTEENTSLGTARPSESVASLGYARPLGDGSFGVSAKFIHQELFDEAGSAWALDAGAQGPAGSHGQWGLSLANAGTPLSLGSTQTKLPLVLRSGLAGKRAFLKGGVGLASVQLDVPADDSMHFRGGLEYAQSLGNDRRAFLRGGYFSAGTARWSLGAGLEVSGVAINYAFSPAEELGTAQRIDVRLRFGAPLGPEVRRTELFLKARSALVSNRLGDAESALDEARSLSPRSREGARLQKEASIQLAETLDPGLLMQQAGRLEMKGDINGAELAYRKVLLVRPNHVDAQKGLDRLAAVLADRRSQEARAAVAKAKERQVQALVRRAQDNMKRDNWESALDRWDEVLALEAGNTVALDGTRRCRQALYQMGLGAQRENRWGEAKRHFRAAQKGIGSYEDSAERIKNITEIEARSRAATAESQRLEATKKYEEGRRLYRLGNGMKAKELFEEAVRLDPDNPTYRRALDRARQETGPRTP